MSAVKEFDIIMVGQITIDDLVLMDAPVKPDNMGGDAIYGLSGIHMWNRDRVGLVMRKGTDFDLEELRKLTNNRVDFTGVRNVDTPNLRTFELFDRYGTRYFIMQKWGGDNKDLSPEGIDDYPERYRGNARAICVAPIPFPWCRSFLSELPKTDEILLVDPHYDAVYGENRSGWDDLFPKIDIWAPSENELMDYFGIGQKDDVRDYIPYMKEITDKGPSVCVLKLGARGAMAYEKGTGKTWHVPAYPSHVVDVTGCGDTFCGGFISGYMQNRNVFEALAHGVIAASFCIDHYDSRSNYLVTEEEVRERLRDFPAVTEEANCII